MKFEIPKEIEKELQKKGGWEAVKKALPMEEIRSVAGVMKALSSETQLNVLYALAEQRMCVCMLVNLTECAYSKCSYHISILKDEAYGSVLGEVKGNAAYTWGHTDCQEVVYGKNAAASSTSSISVKNPLAKITHEASIGRIDKKELETLMARGLEEEEAVDLIVNGILK